MDPSGHRERELGTLGEALNSVFPADNHETIDESMRVMMLTLSQEPTAAIDPAVAAPIVTSRLPRRSLFQRLVLVLRRRTTH